MCIPEAIGFHAATLELERQRSVRRAQRSVDQYFQDQRAEDARRAWLRTIQEMQRPTSSKKTRRATKCLHCGASETLTRASGEVICAYCRVGC